MDYILIIIDSTTNIHNKRTYNNISLSESGIPHPMRFFFNSSIKLPMDFMMSFF